MRIVAAPICGEVCDLSAVPDPVFAQGIVGPGLAVEPEGADNCEVLAPIAGKLVKVKPHAFVVSGDDGVAVLVHLGIDTVKLNGEGFEIHAEEGSVVEVGDLVLRWNPRAVRDQGLSAIVPVVAVDMTADRIGDPVASGTYLKANERLFEVN